MNLPDLDVLDVLDELGTTGASWSAWLAFVRAVYGLPMDEAGLALFRAHTGRLEPRHGGYRRPSASWGCSPARAGSPLP